MLQVTSGWVKLVHIEQDTGDHAQGIGLGAPQFTVCLQLPFILGPKAVRCPGSGDRRAAHALVVEDDLELRRKGRPKTAPESIDDGVVRKRRVFKFNVGHDIDDADHFVAIGFPKLEARLNWGKETGTG